MRVSDRPLPTFTPHDPAGSILTWPAHVHLVLEGPAVPPYTWDSGRLWDDGAVWDPRWESSGNTDTICDLAGVDAVHGGQDNVGLFPAGNLKATLVDPDGRYSRLNPDGTLSDYQIGRYISVVVELDGDWYWIYSGRLTRWDGQDNGHTTTISLEAFNSPAELVPVGRFTAGTAGDLPGPRLRAILAATGHATMADGRFDDGQVTLTVQPSDRSPWEEMQVVSLSDGGWLFPDADDLLMYIDRTWVEGRVDQPAMLVFTDNLCDDEVTVEFADDFERADGPIGGNWSHDPAQPADYYAIDSGELIVSTFTGITVDDRIWWTEPFGNQVDQFIEVTISDLAPTTSGIGDNRYVELYTQMSADGTSSQVVILSPNLSGADHLTWAVGHYDHSFAALRDYQTANIAVTWSTNPTFTFRLESAADGRQVFSINGAVVADFVPANFRTGPYIGLLLRKGTISPRVHSVTGGGLAHTVMVWNPVLSANDDDLAGAVHLTNVAGLVADAAIPDNGRFPILPTLTHSQPDQWTTQAAGDALAVFLLGQRDQAKIKATFQLFLHAPNRDLWQNGIDLRLGDRIRFRHHVPQPGGDGFTIDVGLIVNSLAHSISPAGWVVTVGTSTVVDHVEVP